MRAILRCLVVFLFVVATYRSDSAHASTINLVNMTLDQFTSSQTITVHLVGSPNTDADTLSLQASTFTTIEQDPLTVPISVKFGGPGLHNGGPTFHWLVDGTDFFTTGLSVFKIDTPILPVFANSFDLNAGTLTWSNGVVGSAAAGGSRNFATSPLTMNLQAAPSSTINIVPGLGGLQVFDNVSFKATSPVFSIGTASIFVEIEGVIVSDGLITPEPSTLALAGIGGLAVLAHGVRRRMSTISQQHPPSFSGRRATDRQGSGRT